MQSSKHALVNSHLKPTLRRNQLRQAQATAIWEKKKRRKGKLKRRGSPGATGAEDGQEEEPLFSGAEDAEESKPKKVSKIVRLLTELSSEASNSVLVLNVSYAMMMMRKLRFQIDRTRSNSE